MSADTAAYGAQQVGCVGGSEATGQKVYSGWLDGRVDVNRQGTWEAGIGLTLGTIELIGDRPLVRHGATYEDLGELWYATEAAALAAQADVLVEMAAGLLDQATRLRAAARQEVGA